MAMKTRYLSIIILIISVCIIAVSTPNSFAISGSPSLRFDHLCCLPVLHPGQAITFSIDVHNPNNVSFYEVRPIIAVKSPESHLKIETDYIDVLKPKSIGTVHVKVISDPQLLPRDVTLVTSFTTKSDTSVVKAVDYSDESTLTVQSSDILPPLKQMKLGIPTPYVECAYDTYLVIIKRGNESYPACVSAKTMSNLLNRGWEELRTYLDNRVPPILPIIDKQTQSRISSDKNYTSTDNYSKICDISRMSCPSQQLTIEIGSGIGSSTQGTSSQTINYAIKVEPFIQGGNPLIVQVTNAYSLMSKTYVLPAKNATNGIFYFSLDVNSKVAEDVSHVNFIYNGQRAESQVIPFLPP